MTGIVISGISLGILFGLLGFSIVLLFKCTGVANFAAGAMATLGGFLYLKIGLFVTSNSYLALVVGLCGALLCGAVVYVLVIAPLSRALPPMMLTIRAIGLALFLIAMMDSLWGIGGPYPTPTAIGNGTYNILGIRLTAQDITVVLVTVVIVVIFSMIFKYTRLGLVYRAISESKETALLIGLNTKGMALAAWSFSGFVAALAGIAIAPTALLSPDMMDTYLLYTFAGMILGGFTSLGGTLLGGIIIGVITTLLQVFYSMEMAVIAGFLVIVITLLVKPAGLFGRQDVARF